MPHVWHVRRWSHDAPILTHSSHSRRRGCLTSSMAEICAHESGTGKRAYHGGMTVDRWPELPRAWAATYATLHMWSQIVGKIALAQAPPLNHCWSSALQLTARGLVTRPLPHGERTFTIEFDFIDHQLLIVVSDGLQRSLPLAPRSVAAFYGEVMAALNDMKLPVHIWTMPVEIPNPISFT